MNKDRKSRGMTNPEEMERRFLILEERGRIGKVCSKCGAFKRIRKFRAIQRNDYIFLSAKCLECLRLEKLDQYHSGKTKNYHLAHSHNTRAKKLGVKGILTVEDIASVFESEKCYYCGYGKGVMHLDHVIPVSSGGDNTIENCVLACSFCNQAKGSSTKEDFEEWLNWIRCGNERNH